MENFLRKIGLIEEYSIEIPIPVDKLVVKMNEIVDEDGYEMFEMYSSSKNFYKGTVDSYGFKIKNRLTFSNANSKSVVYGSFESKSESTKIDIQIIGFYLFMKIFYCLLICFWINSILIFFTNLNKLEDLDFALLPIMILFAFFSFIIPYYMMKSGVERMKHSLERDLYYLTKNESKP
jgi:hypothetical protein